MFWERLETLCQTKGMKPQSIRNKIGVSSGVITNWKNGTIPNGETLIKLSSFFECSIDYLLGLDDISNRKEKKSTSELTDLEQRMLAAFREVSYDDKMIEIGRLELLVEKLSQKDA